MKTTSTTENTYDDQGNLIKRVETTTQEPVEFVDGPLHEAGGFITSEASTTRSNGWTRGLYSALGVFLFFVAFAFWWISRFETPPKKTIVTCTASLAGDPMLYSLPNTWRANADGATYQAGDSLFHVADGYTCELVKAP